MIMLQNILLLSHQQEVLSYIVIKSICANQEMILIFINWVILDLFLLKLLSQKDNIFIGCIYRHPSVDICTFSDHYLNPLLEKLLKENDKNFHIGDFNLDLLKFDLSEHINTFLNDLSSNSLHPQILLPTWVSGNSKTVIDNMFSNIAGPIIKNVAAGNITVSISDNLSRFLFLPDFFILIINTREMLKYMTGADLVRTHF